MKRLLSVISIIASLLISQAAFATGVQSNITIDDMGTFMFIGDSYCMAANIDDNDREIPERGWAQIAVNKLGLKHAIIACKGGTGFVHTSSDGASFQTLLDDYYPGEDAAKEVGWVIVDGGYNDHYYSYDEIMIKGEEFVNHAKELYPNAKIAIGMNGWNRVDEDIQNTIVNVVLDAYQDLADYTESIYIEGAEMALYDDFFSNDDFHPNEQGQESIAESIASFMNAQLYDLQIANQIVPPLLDTSNPTIMAPLVIIIIFTIAIIVIIVIKKKLVSVKG